MDTFKYYYILFLRIHYVGSDFPKRFSQAVVINTNGTFLKRMETSPNLNLFFLEKVNEKNKIIKMST